MLILGNNSAFNPQLSTGLKPQIWYAWQSTTVGAICYTLEAEPTTESIIYITPPNPASYLQISEVGIETIIIAGDVFRYYPSGNIITY